MDKINNILTSLPDYARDIKINLQSFLKSNDILSDKQTALIAISCAISLKNQKIVNAFEEIATILASEDEINKSKGAATIMGMNNIYYRFVHTINNKDYSLLATGLRMQIMANHESAEDEINFELCSIAVSALNGCGTCINSHSEKLLKSGVDIKKIQHAIKIASVLNSLNCLV